MFLTTYRFAAFAVACLSALVVACGGVGSTLSSGGPVHQIASPDKNDHSPHGGPSPTPTPTSSPSPQPSPSGSGVVQHVVIIIQENRSVDDLFNGFPGADTAQTGQTHDGQTVRLASRSLAAPGDAQHSHAAWVTDYDSGAMNGFDLRVPQGQPASYNYAFVPQSETVPYWNLASTYTFADRLFQSNTGPSFPAHLYLISGQSDMAAGNPEISGVPVNPWGCDSPRGTIVQVMTQSGQLTNGPFPCLDFTTLADEMDGAGVTWRYYAPALGTSGDVWSAFDAIKHIRFGTDWTHVVSPETQILSDVSGGSLAQVTWVVPSKVNSDHAGSQSTTGPQWVASVVNAIGSSKYWNNTVIFVTWDDWGGWYDHVPPPQLDTMGLGFRVPLIVVSPFAKRAYVSHVQHEFGSILKFTEEQFGLPSLGTTDARADDLSDCFNFGQRMEKFVPVKTRLSPSFFIHQPASSEPPDDY